ncbi:sensor histidine kinase [Chryseobacterium sp. MYb264]|uniref:tetratricopeptide repeat-containing sensor histidine kinase n=1 Tax=Chryseobacterium sp. MYb264 TaxID=2745153 RepID=UPI002E139076|nr:sensor histidine kinase [Chryseobacterium sp. MYb264]
MRHFSLLIFVLFSFSLQSQQIVPLNEKKYTDSLQAVIETRNSRDSKATAYFLLSNYYRNTDTIASKKYLALGKNSSKQFPLLAAKSHYYEGQYLLEKDKEKAAEAYQKAIQELSKIKSEESDYFQSLCWYNYGVAQKNKEGYPFLLKIILEKAIPLLEKYPESKNLGFLYSQLAIILTYNAEFEKAGIYNRKALDILEKTAPNSSELFFAYLNAASNFCYQAKGDEAKKNLDKAEKLIIRYPDSSLNASFYYGKTLYFITKQKHDESLIAIDKGLIYAKKFNLSLLAQMFYFNKYDILRKQKKFGESKAVLENILKEKTLMADANNKKSVYKQLSSLSEEMGDPAEALTWEKKYSRLSDSLHSENVKLEINKLETKFQTAEKEKKIAQKELEINKKNLYLWILGLASLFLMILIISIYLYHKKLTRQRAINHLQNLKEIQQKEELNMAKAILETEEKERERIAKDLHDGLGGMLAGIKINFSTWSSTTGLENNQQAGFDRILDQLDHSVRELRAVARNLMPESLLNLGLEAALTDLCEFYSRNDLEIECQALNINHQLPLSVQKNIYRIIQELLANAVKHSQADSILVQCSQSDSNLMITVEDNGKGFDENIYKTSKSMGIRNLKNRVDYLKGSMEIHSDKEGTQINIELNTDAIS